ncbi:MAG TPA: GAF and ANTAR domain-containing protein [Aeromicrobium sp.]|jgi:GAF domain-containing protein|nr:GAF and ANTAR domain-containing protein [Aeromicrobium sp.]HKY59332.1 GAF and ANTAR domain-containing protein [Aeromicrobium sp.]
MPDLTAEEFAELAVRLHEEATVVETVDLIVQYALRAVDCQYAGVMLVHGDQTVETAAATDPLVEELDQFHVSCGQGPGLEQLDDHIVRVADTRYDLRWEKWARCLDERGVRSVLTARLTTGSSDLGTLNLFHSEPDAFDADDEAVAAILARHAAVALAAARRAENLWLAIDARKLVGQAQGILMERFDLTADQAFAVLLRYSQNKNIKLRDVAQLLVSQRSLPD